MSYPVGTICIGQNFVLRTERNGQLCVIAEPIAFVTTHDSVTGNLEFGPHYFVTWSDGTSYYVRHEKLRRKDWYDEEKRAECQMRLKSKDRDKVRDFYAACEKAAESAIEAGEKVDQEEGAE